MTTKKLGVEIKVGVAGQQQAVQLQQSIDGVSDAAAALDADAAKLNAQLAELGRKQGALDAFKALTRETQTAGKALQEATSRVDALAGPLGTAAEAARSLATAERDTATALAAAKGDLDEKRAALRTLRDEYQGAARKTLEFKEAEAALQAGIGAAKKVVTEKQQALRQAAAATTAAQEAESKLSAEYGKSVSAAAALSTQLGQRRTALEQARSTMRELGLETTGLAETERQLAAATKDTKAQLDGLAPAYQRLAAQQRDMKAVGVESHAAIAKQVAETRAAFERLKASGTLTGAELAQAALKAELRVRELNAQTGSLVETMDRAKGAVVGLATAGAGLAVVSKAAIDFETAMADVRKVVEGTDEQITQLGSELKRLSSDEIPLTAEGLAKIAAAGGQIGVPIEKLVEFTRLAATMATAFDMSAEEAGAAVAKLGNNFELPIEGVAKLGDAINVLGNTTAAKEKDIIEVLTRVGGMATQFGLTAQQTAALASTMLSLGTSSEVVGTGINAMLSKLQTAAEGSTEFREALASIGIDARKLARDVRDHPQQALVDFLGTLDQLDKQSRSELLVKLFGLEYQDDLARLIKALGQYRENLAKVGDETRIAGSMQKEFGERAKTTANQLQLLENSLKALAINIGSVLLPVINPVVSGLRDITGAAAQFAEENPGVTAWVAGIGTAIATVGSLRLAMLAAGAVGRLAFGDLATMAGAMLKPIGEAAGAVGRLQTAFGVLSAGLAGWQLGEWAREEFETVRLLGIALAQGLHEVAEEVQFRWEQMRAVISGDSLADVGVQHQRRLNEIRQGYADLAEQAWDSARAQVKAQSAAADGAESAGERTSQAALAAGAAAATAGTQTASASASAANAVQGVAQAHLGVAAAAAAAGTAGVQAMAGLERVAGGAAASWAEVNKAAAGLGVNLASLSTEVGEGANQALADFGKLIGGLDTLKAKGVDTGAVVRQAIAGMIARASTQADLDAIRGSLTDLARQQRITGGEFALSLGLARDRSNELRVAIDSATPGLDSLRKAANATGADFGRLTTGVSDGVRKGVEGVADLVLQMRVSGVEASRASPILAEALNKQLEAAQTKEELELVVKVIREAEAAGFRMGATLDESLLKARERAKGLQQDYAAIFKDQARYEKALKDSAAYGPGANGGLGGLGGSQDARNAAVKSTVKSDFSVDQKAGTIGSYNVPGPSEGNNGDWYFDAEAANREASGAYNNPSALQKYWRLTPAAEARRKAEQQASVAAIQQAYRLAGLAAPSSAAGVPLMGLPQAVRQHLNIKNGIASLREQAVPAEAPAPAPAEVPATQVPDTQAPSSLADQPASVAALAARMEQLLAQLQAGGSLSRHVVDLRLPNGQRGSVGVTSEADVAVLLDVLRAAAARA